MRARCLGFGLLILPTFLSGCYTPEDRYWHLRRVCDVPEDVFVPVSFQQSTELEGVGLAAVLPVSAACSRALGNQVNLQWQDYRGSPHAYSSIDSVAELVIAGLFTLITADLGTIGELDAAVQEGEGLDSIFADGFEGAGGSDAGPAGAAWLSLVRGGIHTLGPDRGDCGSAAMTRNAEDGYVSTCAELPVSYLDVEVGNSTANMAGLLIHEASHAYLENHDTGEGTTDGAWDRVYSVEQRFLERWWINNPIETLGVYECMDTAYLLDDICRNRIGDTDGFSACVAPPWITDCPGVN